MLNLKSISNGTLLRESCRTEIQTSCSNKQSILEIAYCLADVLFQSKIRSEGVKISNECQKEMRQKLSEAKDNIKFDDELENVCKVDLKLYCSQVQSGFGN